ncbi:MAG TPA: mechanosensitive ion channel [Acidobacteria bacterium]|nr:mechanosensitive ion channel [Acidobacteriota bacterium]
MNQAVEIKDQIIESLMNLLSSVIAIAPRVLSGIVLFLLALIVAKIIERVLRSVLRRMRLESLMETAGLSTLASRLGAKKPLHVIVPRFVYYLLVVLFAQIAAEVLGIDPVSDAIRSVFAYLPNLVAAVLLLVVGSLAGNFVGGITTRAAEESGLDFASSLGSAVSVLILLLSGLMAIGQLKIDTDILRIVTICSLAGMALAFGLSFGLGTRAFTRGIIAGFYARKTLTIGEEVEIQGERGTLTAITPVQTILEHDGDTVVIPNETLLDSVVHQKASPRPER